jgi:hypothetical protein
MAGEKKKRDSDGTFRTLSRQHPRAGWAEAAKRLAASGDDALVWPEYGNREDTEMEW